MPETRQQPIPLHPLERALLSGLGKIVPPDWAELRHVSDISGAMIDQTRRAAEWLKEKGLIESKEVISTNYSLGEEGKRVAEIGLPERRLVEFLYSKGTSDIALAAKELGNEFSIALGRAKMNDWVTVNGRNLTLLPDHKKNEKEELILAKLSKSGITSSKDLSKDELETIGQLSARYKGLIVENQTKEILLKLTDRGRGVLSAKIEDEIDSITPQLLRSGEWRSKVIRAIDVTSPAPSLYGGRKHPMRIFMDQVREIFVSLGFEEIVGSIAQSAFWNFDALFIPQQHTAREMQDTFYVANAKAEISEKEIQEAVRAVHENGGTTGSTGWRYTWSHEEASRVVLRTHTTAVTVNYLAKHKPEDARIFCVGKVFRNEKPNYKHNPEFSQIEGVMVGKDLNLRNLIYIISKFYSKLGFEKIKFWPTYFPYTEPSLQTMVFYEPTQSWMELGGMGVFRPEVTLPLGVKNPVLAWGLSLDRLVMLHYKVTDLRLLFGANLGWLRTLKIY